MAGLFPPPDPESLGAGAVLGGFAVMVVRMIYRLIATIRPLDYYQARLRREMSQDIEEGLERALAPLREDISELKAAAACNRKHIAEVRTEIAVLNDRSKDGRG